VEDHTSLLQIKQSISPHGIDASALPDELLEEDSELETEQALSEDAGFEKFMGKDAATPAGCEDKGCSGSGPNCGGNENECTSRGFVVTGYYKSCGWDTCKTGYKVRCALCPASAAAVPTPAPTPAPPVAVWIPPTQAPAVAGTPPTPAPPIALPTDKPVFAPVALDAGAVGNATQALKAAQASLKALQKNLTTAKSAVKATKKNITLFSRKAEQAQNQFTSNREAAVTLAKKVALANVTIFKAQKAMNNAYFAQKGAEQGAQNALTDAQNKNAMKRYYAKLLIDANYLVKQARQNVSVGEAAVDKAGSDVAYAKRAASSKARADRKDDALKRRHAAVATEASMRMSVKHAMEDAFIAGSVARNKNNTPPWGNDAPPLVDLASAVEG
jgi:hypothetical protein